MRILVTGGAGFVGSNFIRWVMQHQPDVEITNLDKLTYAGNLDNLRGIDEDPRYRFVRGDVCDTHLVASTLEGHDAVVHFAAESHVDRSIDNSAPGVVTNVVGANTVFDAAMRLGVPRCLHISTDEIYGPIDAPGRFREVDRPAPTSPYAASKAGAELLADAYRRTHGYPITITRATNNFGPYHHPEKLIPLFITNLLCGEPLPLYGSGSNVRDWLNVADNAAAQWLVLTEAEPGDTYNVGAGNELTNLELARRLLAHFGRGEEMVRYVTDRPGHDRRYAVETSRLRALGWAPTRDLETALHETIAWYRDNESWWRPLRASGASHRRGRGLMAARR